MKNILKNEITYLFIHQKVILDRNVALTSGQIFYIRSASKILNYNIAIYGLITK